MNATTKVVSTSESLARWRAACSAPFMAAPGDSGVIDWAVEDDVSKRKHNPKKGSWNLLRTFNMLNLQDFFVKFWFTVGVTTASPKFNEKIFHLQHLKRPRYDSNCLF